MTSTPSVTPNELRIAAEHADGIRDRLLRLAFRQTPSSRPHDGRRGIVVLDGAADAGDIELGIDISRDPGAIPDRMTKPTQVTINYGLGNGPADLTELFDALFWSAPAVEKFVLPYYVRLMNPKEFDVLRNAISDSDVRAIGHFKPTVYSINPGGIVPMDATGLPTSSGPLSVDGLLGMLVRTRAMVDGPSEAIFFGEYFRRLALR